jgi:hypothetical protein
MGKSYKMRAKPQERELLRYRACAYSAVGGSWQLVPAVISYEAGAHEAIIPARGSSPPVDG